MPKGSGLLVLTEEPKGKESKEESEEGEDSAYDEKAKTDLAQKFYEAGAEGDFEKAGMVLEKFVHLCTGI